MKLCRCQNPAFVRIDMLHIQTFKKIVLLLWEKEAVCPDKIEDSGEQTSTGLYIVL